MNRSPRHLTGLYPTFNPKKICYNHRDYALGVYVYNENNRKYQRFYCIDCIDKYALSPRVVSPADLERVRELQKRTAGIQVAPQRPPADPGIPTPCGGSCAPPAPAMRVLEGTP